VLSQGITCAQWLGTCPVCGSDAIRDLRVEPVDHPLVHCLVRCGECETCRSLFDTSRAVRRVERRLRRKRRRDRRQIAREARACRRGVALEVWLVGLAAARAVVVSDDDAGNPNAGVRRD
jgi:hypothetical protein